MNYSINLSLTDELYTYVNHNSGKGTLYTSPSEFLRQLIREKKERMEIINLQDGILEGYQDVVANRTTKFSGNLRKDMEIFRKKKLG